MNEPVKILLALGGVLLLGLATNTLGRLTPLPRVTLLLVFGFLIGPGALDLLPESFIEFFDLAAIIALTMVGFLLGGQFTAKSFRERGHEIFWISIIAVVVTAVLVFLALLPLNVGIPMALILGGIAPATAPAATVDVVHEVRAEGPFARTLLGVVAVDDAWGLILFGCCAAAASAMLGIDDGQHSPLASAAWEIGGAVLLGVALGLPTAYLTGHIESGEPTLTEALGVVFLCGGLAIWANVSFLIAPMVLGIVVVNLAKHHTRPFHAIENIEWPFMVVFFVLAGASLELGALNSIGAVAGVYIGARIVGRLAGGWAGCVLAGAEKPLRNWIGVAMMPQAGVALGMALVASSRIPEFRESLLPLVIGSTVFFELTGPVLTRYALHRVGEANAETFAPRD